MAEGPRVVETSKRLASSRQIRAAIVHFRNSQFECAMTLAAAAEGLLPATDKHHFFKTLKDKAKGFNLVIGWLKHGTAPFETATISELEVAATIYRAVTKFNAVYGGISHDMADFLKWAKALVPEL